MLSFFIKRKLDYFDNLETGFLPRGTAIKILKRKILKKLSNKVKNTSNYNYRQIQRIFLKIRMVNFF